MKTRSEQFVTDHSIPPTFLHQKAIEAFEAGFNKDDNSENQIGYQRDYLYYGMTPMKKKGQLDQSVSEYLSFIEVNPYFL